MKDRTMIQEEKEYIINNLCFYLHIDQKTALVILKALLKKHNNIMNRIAYNIEEDNDREKWYY
jgi:hypothetical protein